MANLVLGYLLYDYLNSVQILCSRSCLFLQSCFFVKLLAKWISPPLTVKLQNMTGYCFIIAVDNSKIVWCRNAAQMIVNVISPIFPTKPLWNCFFLLITCSCYARPFRGHLLRRAHSWLDSIPFRSWHSLHCFNFQCPLQLTSWSHRF